MKILVCGLPGSGKTWLAERLVSNIDNCAWYNADFEKSQGRWVICDFVAPTEEARKAFDADYLIWLDTFEEGRVVSSKLKELKNIKNLPFDATNLAKSKKFDDTTKMFEKPNNVDFHITKFLNDKEIEKLADKIKNV